MYVSWQEQAGPHVAACRTCLSPCCTWSWREKKNGAPRAPEIWQHQPEFRFYVPGSGGGSLVPLVYVPIVEFGIGSTAPLLCLESVRGSLGSQCAWILTRAAWPSVECTWNLVWAAGNCAVLAIFWEQLRALTVQKMGRNRLTSLLYSKSGRNSLAPLLYLEPGRSSLAPLLDLWSGNIGMAPLFYLPGTWHPRAGCLASHRSAGCGHRWWRWDTPPSWAELKLLTSMCDSPQNSYVYVLAPYKSPNVKFWPFQLFKIDKFTSIVVAEPFWSFPCWWEHLTIEKNTVKNLSKAVTNENSLSIA
jgi:hypothetical protein